MRFFVILVLVLSVGTGWWVYTQKKGAHTPSQQDQSQLNSAQPQNEATAEAQATHAKEADKVHNGEKADLAKNEAKNEVKKEDVGCFTFHYQAKDFKNPKTFGKNQHLLTLKHAEVNPKSVCVRINETPVAFEYLKKDEPQIILKPILKSNPKITVQYCLRDTSCLDKCVVPKDEFMESIGGIAKGFEQADKQKVKWDPSQKDNEPDLKKELTGLLEDAPGKDTRKLPVYSEWNRDEGTPSCQNAKKSGGREDRKVASRKGN